MTYLALLFAPLVVLLPAAATVDTRSDLADPGLSGSGRADGMVADEPAPDGYALQIERQVDIAPDLSAGIPVRFVPENFGAPVAHQVRIEQRMTIRVAPRPQPMRPDMLVDLPNRSVGPKFLERKMGKCLKVTGIAGVQPQTGNRLLLFLRDRRIVSAELERSCRSRDFYSGFYLSRSDDGKLCIDRDSLLSRSGANCKLTRLRQLVEDDD